MINGIIQNTLDTFKHVRDTFTHLGEGKISQAAESYIKSVPGVVAATKAIPYVTRGLATSFSSTAGGTVLKTGVNTLGKLAVQSGKWYLTPASAVGKKGAMVGKQTAAKLGTSGAKLAGTVAAVVAGEHVIAKVAKSSSTIDFVRGVTNKEIAKQQFGKDRNFVQNVLDLLLAGPQRRGFLQLIHGKEVRNK